MSTTVSGGLVWGVPVRPDKLVEHLEVFEKALPSLNALRLCHRFGKGPNVYITKLPIEIVQAIEAIIFDSKIEPFHHPFSIFEAFEHFEGRCQPSDHVYDDRHMDLRDDAYEEIRHKLCKKCKKDQFHMYDCSKDCNAKVQEQMNEMCCDGDMEWEDMFCEPARSGWEELTTSEAKFAPFQAVQYPICRQERRFAYFCTDSSQTLRTRSLSRYDSSQRQEQRPLAETRESRVARPRRVENHNLLSNDA